MKYFVILSAAVLFSFLPGIAVAQPNIQLDRSKTDLGTIYHGEIRTVKIAVVNTGNQPLVISNIETACGCTSAKKHVPVIEPGRSDTVEVSFNSMGFDGKIKKEVMIYSNDPDEPMSDVMLSGFVVSELETVPKMTVMNFGISAIGVPARSFAVFKNTSGDRITITGITGADTSLKFQARKYTIEPSDTVSVMFMYTPRSTALSDQTIYVQTTSPRQPRVPFRFMYAGK